MPKITILSTFSVNNSISYFTPLFEKIIIELNSKYSLFSNTQFCFADDKNLRKKQTIYKVAGMTSKWLKMAVTVTV